MTTAAIYARVSSARQKEEQTIASQTAALRAYAAAQGLEIPPGWVFEDEGYSGATLLRPALERLRDLAAEVGIPVLLCYAPDRLARRYAYQVLLVEELGRVGTEVRFLRGPKAETPEDQLLLQFQGMIAEYERAQIAERTRRGRLHRARAGFPSALSAAPYGYRYVRKSEEAEARYEIIESQAAVVREVFRRYVEEQVSVGHLTRWLRAQGIPTARGQTFWNRGALWKMLCNPAYCGRAAFGKRRRIDQPGRITRVHRQRSQQRALHPATRACPRDEWIEIAVPAIVSEELFELAQRRLEDNKRFATRRTKVRSLLQGLAVCELCGYSFVRSSGCVDTRKYHYYRCLGSHKQRFANGRLCANRPVRQDHLDDVVWTQVMALLTEPQLIRTEIDRRLLELQAEDPLPEQTARIELELRRTTRARERLMVAYQEELISLEELRRRMPGLRDRESTLRSQLGALQAQVLDREAYLQLAETIESFLVRLRDSADRLSVEDRQRVVRLLVKEVLVGPERVIVRHSIPTRHPSPEPGYRLRCRDLVLEALEAELAVEPPLQDLAQDAADLEVDALEERSGRTEPAVELGGAASPRGTTASASAPRRGLTLARA